MAEGKPAEAQNDQSSQSPVVDATKLTDDDAVTEPPAEKGSEVPTRSNADTEPQPTSAAKPGGDAGVGTSATSLPESIVAGDANSGTGTHSRKSTLENTVQPQRSRSRDRSISPGKKSPRKASPTSAALPQSSDLPVLQPTPVSLTEKTNTADQRSAPERVASPPPPGNLARKASGFGALFGRMGNIRRPTQSPPASRPETRTGERRNTNTSVSSADGGIDGGARSKRTLQDQFSNLRREQESSIDGLSQLEEGDEATPTAKTSTKTIRPTSPTSPPALKSPPMDPTLPPGTAAGLSAGPAELPREVNWDLWQQVVYEGPAAVARTSGEELNQAIASGIPPAIRGVVWQVLADSKSPELEDVYRMLKARGTEAEVRPRTSRNGSTATTNGTSAESIVSDASSVHSDNSTPGNSTITSTTASIDTHNSELQSKLLAEKQKREAAALQKLEKAIKRDMGTRTSYSKFTQSAGLQDGLFGVCKAYALFDEGVGYAQGINFIAMPLLFNMSEEEAFTLLVRVMSKYDLRSLFIADMPGLHLRLYQFERLLEDYEPAVYCHLRRRNVEPQLYATQWFLTLFAYRFPLQLVLRVYDLILSEGLVAILKFGIVLMQQNRATLLEMKDMAQLTTFLKEKIFDVYIDKSPSASSLLDSGFFGSVTGGADKELYRADEMVADACEIKITDATLAKYTLEWEENQRTTRLRETELETLKATNSTLSARVKSLEERVQQSDAEHVTMAHDLVRLKVENDSLLDANEALKLKTTELQRLLDAQPAELEEKLKSEMDRIMTRNIEVQNENRHLKDEMDEMEHALVNVKMLHAQAQTDHDALKQKWTSVQALLSDKS
ncbi:RabGAP/TBC [Dissoconium aciculare CBS 342.82]|uniref:GTPase-activating protein GYP5 n=1 Tax=Dissoconium aciculare CBS 342.82 TaxID=1314786 RepID=A0A6J3M2K3_9PEZI|nr:RabGAP/TBC [Dissoconium aciculare CBS 342.82]KAF1821147.1 RabGAP/TBC [Dissoconium aciculare CBS 342.82]